MLGIKQIVHNILQTRQQAPRALHVHVRRYCLFFEPKMACIFIEYMRYTSSFPVRFQIRKKDRIGHLCNFFPSYPVLLLGTAECKMRGTSYLIILIVCLFYLITRKNSV